MLHKNIKNRLVILAASSYMHNTIHSIMTSLFCTTNTAMSVVNTYYSYVTVVLYTTVNITPQTFSVTLMWIPDSPGSE